MFFNRDRVYFIQDDGHKIKAQSFTLKEKVSSVICDEGHECPDDNTCCKLDDGSWGCCPVKNAVCCDDHIHCCSPGSKCDTGHGRCTSESGMLSQQVVGNHLSMLALIVDGS